MTLDEAQADMRQAYFGGAAGIFASALVWLAAALVSHLVSPRGGIATLFIGGMLIHPAAMLLSKLLGRTGAHAKDNPLGRLAIESTVWMLLAIPLAFLLSFQRVEWFFVAMLLTIGGRYFTFATLYGMRVYWLIGAVLAGAALGLVALNAGSSLAALAGGVIELIFACVVFAQVRGRRLQTAA
jgi:hypothetical protein